MRVMVIVKATKNSEAGIMPGAELLGAMGRFNEERFANGRKTVIDGPFAETKELVAGFWIWQVKSLDEALEWARRCPDPMPGEESELEIRPLFELADFGELTPELQAQQDRLRSQLEAQKSS
jgi:hypothetical protein